jgi:two-component system sensor histidine kinase/response regulator
LIDTFLEDGPQLLGELSQSLEDQNAGEVRRVAHSLKSNGADLGATTFSELCKKLEMMAKSGTLQGAVDLVAQIKAEYQSVETALKSVQSAGSLDA